MPWVYVIQKDSAVPQTTNSRNSEGHFQQIDTKTVGPRRVLHPYDPLETPLPHTHTTLTADASLHISIGEEIEVSESEETSPQKLHLVGGAC